MSLLQVYIVKCIDGKYYTGVSNDVERRLYEHNNSEDTKSFTYCRRPILLKWASEQMDPDQAIELEKQVKGWSRQKKEALIKGEWEKLPSMSLNKYKRNKTGSP